MPGAVYRNMLPSYPISALVDAIQPNHPPSLNTPSAWASTTSHDITSSLQPPHCGIATVPCLLFNPRSFTEAENYCCDRPTSHTGQSTVNVADGRTCVYRHKLLPGLTLSKLVSYYANDYRSVQAGPKHIVRISHAIIVQRGSIDSSAPCMRAPHRTPPSVPSEMSVSTLFCRGLTVTS